MGSETNHCTRLYNIESASKYPNPKTINQEATTMDPIEQIDLQLENPLLSLRQYHKDNIH